MESIQEEKLNKQMKKIIINIKEEQMKNDIQKEKLQIIAGKPWINKYGNLLKCSKEKKAIQIKITKKIETYKKLENKNKKLNKFIKDRETSNIKTILYLLIIITIISKSIPKESQVTIRVSKNGNQKVFSESGPFTPPDEVYINDQIQEFSNTYDLQPDKIVKLVWKKTIENCYSMFDSCEDIVEINFIDFDTSQSNHMWGMFRNCYSLISLDLSGFDTTNVGNMGCMFFGCRSLISLDISNFNLLNNYNLGNTFCGCTSLKSINLSNLDTSTIQYMDNLFNGCENLISIDLSNFKTSSVVNMEYMFNDCKSLVFL